MVSSPLSRLGIASLSWWSVSFALGHARTAASDLACLRPAFFRRFDKAQREKGDSDHAARPLAGRPAARRMIAPAQSDTYRWISALISV